MRQTQLPGRDWKQSNEREKENKQTINQTMGSQLPRQQHNPFFFFFFPCIFLEASSTSGRTEWWKQLARSADEHFRKASRFLTPCLNQRKATITQCPPRTVSGPETMRMLVTYPSIPMVEAAWPCCHQAMKALGQHLWKQTGQQKQSRKF